jgi:MYXO-CTERM domain-containing protein
MLIRNVAAALALAAVAPGSAAAGHQVKGYVSQAGLDFISELVPSLVPSDIYPGALSKDFACMTATQQNTHIALAVHDFSITIPQEGRLRVYLNISADGDGELLVDDVYACFGEMTCQDQIVIHDARATIDFDIMLDGGKPTAVFQNVDLQLSEDDIDINFSGCAADDVANWMIDFAKEYVTDMLLAKAEEMAVEALGPKVEEMLGGVGAFSGQIQATDFTAALQNIFVKQGGVDIGVDVGLSSMFEPAECVRELDEGAPEDLAGDVPDLGQVASHLGLALNFGLVNSALYQVWRQGLTCIDGDSLAALGVHLPTDHIMQLLPGFPPGTTLDMEMRLSKPPRLAATGGNDDVDTLDMIAVIEGIELKLIGHKPDGTDKTIDVGMDARVTMALGVDPASNAMVATPVGMEMTRMEIDQVYAAETGVDAARVLQVAHEQLLPKLLAKLGAMPVTGPVFSKGEYAVILRGVGNNEAFLSLNADLFHIPEGDIGSPETSIIEYPSGPVSVASSAVRVSGVDGMIPTELLRYNIAVNGEARPMTYVRTFTVGTAGESGTYDVQVSAVDLGGNTDDTPASVQVTVDGISPVVYLEGERVRAMDGGTTDLSWTMSDDMTESALLGARIELYEVKDETDLLSREHVETIELPPGVTSATVEIADGAMYQAELHVTDAVGNESIATVLLDSKNGCGCSAGGGSTGLTTLFAGLGLLLVLRRRRRQP